MKQRLLHVLRPCLQVQKLRWPSKHLPSWSPQRHQCLTGEGWIPLITYKIIQYAFSKRSLKHIYIPFLLPLALYRTGIFDLYQNWQSYWICFIEAEIGLAPAVMVHVATQTQIVVFPWGNCSSDFLKNLLVVNKYVHQNLHNFNVFSPPQLFQRIWTAGSTFLPILDAFLEFAVLPVQFSLLSGLALRKAATCEITNPLTKTFKSHHWAAAAEPLNLVGRYLSKLKRNKIIGQTCLILAFVWNSCRRDSFTGKIILY